ncbi:MAG: PhzF family phenazine biosynthesis protein [Solirubrobacterales bacterium]|nr:PhzF family phenazine biosynthesis protein [Solirubrobacterales bacterium]
MSTRAFRQVDVFTIEPYRGNPVAVVLDADGLDDAQMQRFANWTNLSETTFLLEPTVPGADYRVRIFTPSMELPFAGHPTLGSAHVWLERHPEAATRERVVQECAAGLIELRRDGEGRLAFAAPPRSRSGPVDEALIARVAGLLGVSRDAIVDAEWADNGPPWVAILLGCAREVLALRQPVLDDLFVGVVGAHPESAEAAFEVRAFFPQNGVTVEDPVTGSLNAALAQWLLHSGRASAPYVAAQGTVLGRAGRVHVSQDCHEDATIWIGGGTVTCVSGDVEL